MASRQGIRTLLDPIAEAESEAGQLNEATGLTEKAVVLASEAGNAALAAQWQSHLRIYRAHHSYPQAAQNTLPTNH